MNSTQSRQVGVDALLQALTIRDEAEVTRLIAAGADPNGAENSGEPLATAIQSGDVALVRALIRLGAAVNPEPVKAALKCRILRLGLDNQEIFDVIVKAGIDLNCRAGQFGSTQLMDIAGYNRLWAWDRIHTSETQNNERLRDPMSIAKRLLNGGADPNARDELGRTAVFYTMDPNNIDILELLLSSGADPNVSIDSHGSSFAQQVGSTPLMTGFGPYSISNDPSMIKLLLANGANPNYRNESKYDREWDETTSGAVTFAGQTALTRAAADGYHTLVRLLLESGADPLIPREDGMLAEEIAKQNKHSTISALIANYKEKRK